MKNFLLIILLLIAYNHTKGQIINMNPDPYTEPWWSGDLTVPINGINDAIEFNLSIPSISTELPDSIDNSSQPYFPDIIVQQGQSCAQVNEISYIVTYEINRSRNLIAGVYDYNTNHNHDNLYNYLFTYNMLNEGIPSTFTTFGSGFEIVKEIGCPSFNDFFDPALQEDSFYKYWMTDYSKYKAGMNNTIENIYTFEFTNDTSEWLTDVRHWLADHGNGESTGGLLEIAIKTDGWNIETTIPGDSPYWAGHNYISSLGNASGHSMTIVGYNDEVYVQDLNNDGKYTNNIDVTGNGVVDIRDFEKGVFRLANTWNPEDFGNEGYILIPYKSFKYGALGFEALYALTCAAFPSQTSTEPLITIKTELYHTKRKQIKLKMGYGVYASSENPQEISELSTFNFQGGPNVIRGTYAGPIEIGLNYGQYYVNDDFGKIFLRIVEKDPLQIGEGYINSFSIIDHRWGEDFELGYPISETILIPNKDSITLGIEYHLLPHSDNYITNTLKINSNRISRFITTVKNNSNLEMNTGLINNEAKLDMYSSEINIEIGSNLILGDKTKIIAKRGICKLNIDGNITVGKNVEFIAEAGAVLEINFLNSGNSVNFEQTDFVNVTITSSAASLTFDDCNFNNCEYLYSRMGNVTILNCDATNTGFYLETDSRRIDDVAIINNCTLISSLEGLIGIMIKSYANYNISMNNIAGYYNGIDLSYAGYGLVGSQIIENNIIHSCQMNGIIAYNSIGSIFRNNIYNNNYGIRFMNNCNFALHGDPLALTLSETQQISNNISCEVYTSEFGFPYYFRFNSIVDPDNAGKPTDPLLLFDRPVYANTTKADVAYNHWGSGFNQSQDLMGNNVIFFTYPFWTPGTIPSTSPDEDLYTSASNNFSDGSYSVAKSQYILLIDLYPKSQYAEAAMKDLVRLEEYLEKDYSGLKEYFLTNDSINADTTLTKLADISANQCDVKQQNYPVAIEWYENRIENSGNTADSIYAVIDLGYLYLLMEEDGLKSNYIGQHPEFKPVNELFYSQKKNYLLSLLPETQTHKTSLLNKNEQIIYNYPNPANQYSTISYILDSQTNVVVRINDNTGKLVAEYKEGNKSKGLHNITVNTSSFSSGLYFYSLFADGNLIQTQKMSVVNN